MRIKFDALERLQKPSMVLCNPNGEELNTIDGIIYDCEFTLRFNTMSEVNFTVPSTFEDGSINIWYNLVRYKRLIRVENIGVFQIQEVSKESDGMQDIKQVTAFSLECDLNYKKVNLLSGIYKFYNPLTPNDTNTLIGNLMSMPQMRGWSIGTVSSDLWNKTRSYEVSDQTVYNFLMTTVEEALECVVTFDTFNKTISFTSVDEVVKETDIFLSYENLVTNLEVTEMGDELVTAMSCYGGGELTIRGVNPLGDVVIYDFSYFTATKGEWLSDTLRNKIIAWQSLQDSKQKDFSDLLTQYRTANTELITLNGELTNLKSEYTVIEGLLKTEIEAGGSTATYATQLQAKENEINAKQSEINTKQSQVESIQSSISSIQNLVKMTSNFTDDELKELSCYINESTYTNDNFIQTSVMTAVEIQDMQQELYEYSKKVLSKLSQPRYSFEMESANFLFLKEFQPFASQLELGSQVTVDMGNGVFSYPVLLELTFSYDDPTNFSMTFGNRLRLDKNDYRFSELFGDTVNTASTVTIKDGNWSEFNNNYQDDVSNFMKNELIAAQKNIINAANQEIKIGEHGLIGQRMLDSGAYDGKKIWLMNNQIVFTRDNFKTVEAMFGEMTNGGYGLAANILIGDIIAGNQLTISNDSNTFRVDENGVYIKNANIIMSSGDTIEEAIENVTYDASQSLANAVQEINTTISNLESQITEGEMTVWYQDTEPDAKAGDIWYDTGNKNKAWLAQKGGTPTMVSDSSLCGTFIVAKSIEWVPLEDKEILDALEAAQNAQDTADGKITTFYSATEPTGASEGDLWFDTDDKNHQYIYRSGKWTDVQDGMITNDNLLYNSLPNKGDNNCWGFGVGVSNFYHVDLGTFFVLKYPSSGEVYLSSKRYLCEPNTTYTISFEFSGSGYTENGAAMFYILESNTLTDINQIGGAYDTVKGFWMVGGTGDNNWEKKTYTFTTASTSVSLYVRFDAKSFVSSPNKGDDYWLRKIKIEKGNRATAYTKASGEDSYYSSLAVSNKVSNVLTSDGLLDTNKMKGQILGGTNNIYCVNNANNKALLMNDTGILIANSKLSDGNWNWRTAISADGIVADMIQSGGTITGCKIVSTGSNSTATLYNSALFGTLNGTNNFILDMTDDRGGSLQLAKTSGNRMEMVAQQSYTIGATDYTPSFIYSSTMLLLRSSVRVCVDGDLFVTGRICKSWNGGFKSGDYVEL